MKLDPTPEGRNRPAVRGPKVHAAVLAATLTELAETGYAALTVDNVARRSGVHKTTIYRRWKDRERPSRRRGGRTRRHGENALPRHQRHRHRSSQARTGARRVAEQPDGRAHRRRSTSDAGRIPEVAAAKRRFFEASSGKRSRSSPAPSHAASSRRHRSSRADQGPSRADLPAAPGHRRAGRQNDRRQRRQGGARRRPRWRTQVRPGIRLSPLVHSPKNND